jgi:Dullard-like phosphatase family protein
MTYLYSPQTQYAWSNTGLDQSRIQYSNGGSYTQGFTNLRDSVIMPGNTTFTNYVASPSIQNHYSMPTYQNPTYVTMASSPQTQANVASRPQNYFTFPTQQPTGFQGGSLGYKQPSGVSQAFQPTVLSGQLSSMQSGHSMNSPVGPSAYPQHQQHQQHQQQQHHQQSGNNSPLNPLRQLYGAPQERYSPSSRPSEPRISISSSQDYRSFDVIRDSQNVSIYGGPSNQSYVRSNSVSNGLSDPLRASVYSQPQLDFTRNRSSTMADGRNQPLGMHQHNRPPIAAGNQNPNLYRENGSTIYQQPVNKIWNPAGPALAAIQIGSNTPNGSGSSKKLQPIPPILPLPGDKDESFHGVDKMNSGANSQPVSSRTTNSKVNLSPGVKNLSPENKRNNPLLFGISGASTTPSKPEVQNLNIHTTPGSFIISEPSTPTTPDPRGNHSTHGKSLRSIKLFETPSQNNHAYPNVGHQSYNPAVPLTVSHSMKGLPPVKIDIHTDSCYNYLNKRMYFDNHEAHTPLEQFFFRESLGQFKVAQMLAPHLSTVKLPAPIKVVRRKKYMLVLDIDETLVHSELIVEQNVPRPDKAHISYDRKLEFPNPNGTFDVYGIRYRPFLMEFLHRMSKLYDLALYTASAQDYGNAVANELDPAGNLFVARLFRENCIHVNGVNVKSMKNFEGPDVYLVDNLIYSFPFDLDRGIPICPFVDDAMDVELKDLAEILENLPSFESLHALVNELLGLKDFYSFLGKKISSETNSQPISPILKQHEAATQSTNDRTAGTNTIYF